jgi:ethanolamine utilization microcompartment shell protein EutS
MAVRFDASGDYLRRTANVPSFAGPYTWMGWIYLAATGGSGQYHTVWVLNRNNVEHYDGIYIQYDGSNSRLLISVDNGTYAEVRSSVSDLSAGTWYHVTLVRSSTTAIVAYLNGVAEVTGPTQVHSQAATQMDMGVHPQYPGDTFNGRVAGVKVWDAALAPAEIALERWRYIPSRKANLTYFTPIFSGSGERGRDYSGNSWDWTEGGTLTDEAGPPLSWGGSSWLLHPASGAPNNYNQNVAGSISPVGVLVKRAAKNVAGSISPVGVLRRSAAKSLAGTITPAGVLTKVAAKVIAGSIAPAGTLTSFKSYLRTLSGSISPAGTVIRQSLKNLAGSLTPSGTLNRQALKVLIGSIAPVGTIATAKSYFRTLTGAVSLSGSLIRQTVKHIAGTITPGGALIRQALKSLTGNVTPIGVVTSIKAFLVVLAGSITPNGTLTRSMAKVLAGSITPNSTLLKAALKRLAGSMVPTGSISAVKAYLRLLSGSIGPVGLLNRQTTKVLAGSITPQGSVLKQMLKRLAGLLGLTGNLTANGTSFIAQATIIIVEPYPNVMAVAPDNFTQIAPRYMNIEVVDVAETN